MDVILKCQLCGADTPAMWLLHHVPQCYRQICNKLSFVPMCTCNSCKAEHTHPGDTIDGFSLRKRTSPDSTDEEEPLLCKRVTSAPPPPPATTVAPPPSLSQQQALEVDPPSLLHAGSYNKLSGKICLVCGATRSPSALKIPYLSIGKYRKVMICKKSHLTDDAVVGHICAALEWELTRIKNLGESPLVSVLRSSVEKPEVPADGLNEATGVVQEIGKKCDSYVDLEKTRCSADADGILYLKVESLRRFCKPTHALRYLVIHYGAQGKRGAKAKSSDNE
jgi:hypothetical protein